jgi:hypothetical protein
MHMKLYVVIGLCSCTKKKKNHIKKIVSGQVLVAHICNPSYSEDRDQKDHGSRPVQANS